MIVVIAVFYTSSIHLTGLLVAVVASAAYAVLQWRRVRSSFVYLPLAAVAWAAMIACSSASGRLTVSQTWRP